jgi:hypothetical protein
MTNGANSKRSVVPRIACTIGTGHAAGAVAGTCERRGGGAR